MNKFREWDKIDPQDKIWRYMDLSKFIMFLKKGLWFPRVDYLEDKFEGKTTKNSGYDDNIYREKSAEFDNNIVDPIRKTYEDNRRWHVVNCWTHNEYESVALWKHFIRGECGVAIQSTYGKLRAALKENCAKMRYIGKVQYIDRRAETLELRPLVLPVFRKDNIYQHENEIRAVINTLKQTDSIRDDPCSSGMYLSVDLNNFIDRVIVAPNLSSWKIKLIEILLCENIIYKKVQKSRFDDESY